MDTKELYEEALKQLHEKEADYNEKGIFTFAYTEGVALFLLAISSNGVIHITEYTPWRIKASVRPEVTPEGVELHFSLPNIKGKALTLSSLINYLSSVREGVYAMQRVLDEKVNAEVIKTALGVSEDEEK